MMLFTVLFLDLEEMRRFLSVPWPPTPAQMREYALPPDRSFAVPKDAPLREIERSGDTILMEVMAGPFDGRRGWTTANMLGIMRP